MFVAIVVPEMKKSKAVVFVVLLSIVLSCAFYYTPVLKDISSGLTISICAILAAVVGAICFPVSDEAKSTNADTVKDVNK